jgi:putative PIN family toxin of toxin-antitoxin system
MKCYAVIDTNVLVSSLLTKHNTSATVLVVERLLDGTVIPVFSNSILEEYSAVLHRDKFGFAPELVDTFLQELLKHGIIVEPEESDIILPDMKDVPFYVVALNSCIEDTFLVIGNIKHFPAEPFIVTPAQFLEILQTKFQD